MDIRLTADATVGGLKSSFTTGVDKLVSDPSSFVPDKRQIPALQLLFQRAFSRGFRRKDKQFYQPMLSPFVNFPYSDHTRTRCYTRVCTIEEFIYECVFSPNGDQRLLNYLLYFPGNTSRSVQTLARHLHHGIPELETNLSMVAFQDGVYDVNNGHFYTFVKIDGQPWVGDLQSNVLAIQNCTKSFIPNYVDWVFFFVY